MAAAVSSCIAPRNFKTPRLYDHKAGGQSCVTLNGRTVYLGEYDLAETQQKHRQLIARRVAEGQQLPVAPVTMTVTEVIDATRPVVSRPVWAIIRLQLFTAARPGELLIIRPRDVDRMPMDVGAVSVALAEIAYARLVALFYRQTSDEQEREETRHRNGVGFASCHASVGSYYARWIMSGRRLTGPHLERARKMMRHYTGQLSETSDDNPESAKLVREAGFKLPMAMTMTGFCETINAGTIETEDGGFVFPPGKSLAGRLWAC